MHEGPNPCTDQTHTFLRPEQSPPCSDPRALGGVSDIEPKKTNKQANLALEYQAFQDMSGMLPEPCRQLPTVFQQLPACCRQHS